MIDNYWHSDVNIIYVTESIPGPADETLEYDTLLADYNSRIVDNCYCKNKCTNSENTVACHCLHISHGENYILSSDEGVFNYILNIKCTVFKDYPIIECNSNCPCPANCGNRIVQQGPMEGLIVKQCDNTLKGLGLFAPCFINKGTFICEYAGELLTKRQALKRTAVNEAEGKMNYIFCLNEHTYEGFHQTFVDPSIFGNIGRYVNHSCKPNCIVVPVRCEITIPKLAIFACADILQGEEITFSYSSESKPCPSKTILNPKQNNCLCNTQSCKRFLPSENL